MRKEPSHLQLICPDPAGPHRLRLVSGANEHTLSGLYGQFLFGGGGGDPAINGPTSSPGPPSVSIRQCCLACVHVMLVTVPFYITQGEPELSTSLPSEDRKWNKESGSHTHTHTHTV